MKVFITGASGFLGGRLAAQWHARGHEISGSGATAEEIAGLPAFVTGRECLPLGDPCGPDRLAGRDLIVHCAFAEGAHNRELNVRGTILVAEAARDAGVPDQLFLSSYSARPDAISGYGQMKYELELWFLESGQRIVRPGLVVGAGGLFARMVGTVRRLPVVPLPGGGRSPVPLIGIDDFAEAMTRVIESSDAPASNLCYERQPTLAELLRLVAAVAGRHRLFLPLPIALLLAPVTLAARFGIDLGIDGDSLRGYRTNTPGVHRPDLGELGLPDSALLDVVRAALEELDRSSVNDR